MSYPVLYPDSNISAVPKNNGIGVLSDCISCKVTEDCETRFELEMQYPVDGIHFKEIKGRSIIKAKPNQTAEPQLFRVYSIDKNISRTAKIKAAHISYDLSSIPVRSFVALTVVEALEALQNQSIGFNPFSFSTEMASVGTLIAKPGSVRSKLVGNGESVLGTYGGEFEFDNYKITLHDQRGKDNGVSIRYGKNLTNLKQDVNFSNIFAGIYPFWWNEETTEVVELYEPVYVPGYNYGPIKAIDLTGEFESEPTQTQLREKAVIYVNDNKNIAEPSVSMTISYAQIDRSEEYRGLEFLERISLFDTVGVEFPDLDISTKVRAVKVVYDVLLDRVDSISLGSVKYNITDTIIDNMGRK